VRRGWEKRWLGVGGVLLSLVGCNSTTPDSSILKGPIAVGVVDFAPGFAMGSPNPAGFDIDVMNAIGAGLHTPVANTPLTSADRAGKLTNGTATLVIATYSITMQRNQDGIDFAGPYLITPQALLVRTDDTRIIANKDSLAGKSVCTVSKTTNAAVDIPNANMTTRKPTIRECIDLLNQHGTDAVFNDTVILYGYTHAYPGKFKVVLSSEFGELQYYGVGMLGKHHADCLKLNSVIKEYLRTQWRHDFADTLPDAAAAYSGGANGDFESQFKPKDSDMTTLSCKL
jgi:glutamate transport system substrate-binding protein